MSKYDLDILKCLSTIRTKEIKLKLGEPVIRCWQYDAIPLMILANDDNYLEWLYCHYIQIFCSKKILKDSRNLHLEYFKKNQALECPYLDWKSDSRKFINDSGINIIDSIKCHIQKKYYFYGHVDHYYISYSKDFNNRHFIHDLLIYGYNDINREFHAYEYGPDGRFKTRVISYIQFRKAFESETGFKYWWEDKIYYFTRLEKVNYAFDKVLMKEQLEEYLYSVNTSLKYRAIEEPWGDNWKAFGMDVYEYVRKYLSLVAENKIIFDPKSIYFIYEHKLLMLKRIDYLNRVYENNKFFDIYGRYHEILDNADICVKFTLKMKIIERGICINKILERINKIEMAEKEVLPDLLEII